MHALLFHTDGGMQISCMELSCPRSISSTHLHAQAGEAAPHHIALALAASACICIHACYDKDEKGNSYLGWWLAMQKGGARRFGGGSAHRCHLSDPCMLYAMLCYQRSMLAVVLKSTSDPLPLLNY